MAPTSGAFELKFDGTSTATGSFTGLPGPGEVEGDL